MKTFKLILCSGIGLSDHLSSYYNLQKYPHSLAHLHFRSNSCLDPFHCHNIHYPVMHAMEGRCRDCFILRERERDHYHHGYTETIPSAIEKPNWGERVIVVKMKLTCNSFDRETCLSCVTFCCQKKIAIEEMPTTLGIVKIMLKQAILRVFNLKLCVPKLEAQKLM